MLRRLERKGVFEGVFAEICFTKGCLAKGWFGYGCGRHRFIGIGRR
jgi:hypothetical protein